MTVTGEDLRAQFDRLIQGLSARREGASWKACCPCHDDKTGSLDLAEKDGKVLVKCFAGCDQGAVIEALRDRGLWPKREPANGSGPILPPGVWRRLKGTGHVYACHWTYRDKSGREIGHHVRYEKPGAPKETRPFFKKDPSGKWRPGAAPDPRPLYGLDRLAKRPEAIVVITEGEKAADAAQRLLPGYVAVTSWGGASGPAKADWTPLGGRSVIIWPDHDVAGQGYAEAVVLGLLKIGAKVKGIINVSALGLPEKGDAADWPAGKPLPDPLPMVQQSGTGRTEQVPTQAQSVPEIDGWELAAELFPRIDFPWSILPAPLTESLKQLARSCATSPTSLPGCLFCIIGSIAGRFLATSPKEGWVEPSIVWCADIRPSGSGKTPAANLLMKPIHEIQAEAHRKWQAEVESWKATPKGERQGEPEQERAWFVSDLTLEGLREDLENHPTGGLVAIMEELSSFVSAQNQYKAGRGSDREAWLQLFDGNPCRVKRVGRSIMLTGARVSIFGGIQPAVFRRVFGSEDGIYLVDGTVFRFLYTYESDRHFDLDSCAWDETYSRRWKDFIQQTMWWTEQQKTSEPLMLDGHARKLFYSWRNRLSAQRDLLPECFRGFLPKAVGYSLRLAGIIHFTHRTVAGIEPSRFLTVEDIQRGIIAAEFYLGQTVDAMRLLQHADHAPDVQTDPRLRVLAETLRDLQPQIDNGRLSVSFVRDEFNRRIDQNRRFSEKPQSKAFGLFLRQSGLTVSESLQDFRDQRRVKCLLYDENVLHLLHLLQTKEESQLADGEHHLPSSPSSPMRDTGASRMENMENIGEHLLHPQSSMNKGNGEHGEHGEDVSMKKSCTGMPPCEWPEGEVTLLDEPVDYEVF